MKVGWKKLVTLFDMQPKAIILLNMFKHGFHLDLAPWLMGKY